MQSMKKIAPIASLFALALMSGCGGGNNSATREAVPLYSLTELSELDVPPIKINNSGQIIATRRDPYGLSIYENGTWTFINGDTPDDQIKGSRARDINDSGLILGSGYFGSGMGMIRDLYFLMRVPNRREAITLPRPSYIESASLNSRGEVIFATNDVPFGNRNVGWLLRDGEFTELPFQAFIHNAQGVIAGEKDDRPVVWQNGTLTALPIPPQSTYGATKDINERGQIVGFSFGDDADSVPLLWQQGQMQMLGDFGGKEGRATAINSFGDVVGSSRTTTCYQVPRGGGIPEAPPTYEYCEQHAFIWRSGQMIDLNTRLATPTDWVITEASDINDKGQIVAYAFRNRDPNHQTITVLLTPILTQ